MNDVRASLARARHEAGLSQGKIAAVIDIRDQGHVSRVERGMATTTLDKAAIWADACGYDLVLVRRDAPGAAELAAELGGLDGDARAIVRQLGDVLARSNPARRGAITAFLRMMEGDLRQLEEATEQRVRG